jgi:hypothetical protein
LGEVSVAFFDTTSLWFEGAGGERLGQRGHSKDYRGHLIQVVLGIVLDGEDRPIVSFLLPGNTADVTQLVPAVRRLRERFGIARACLVADRGMISGETITALEAEKIEYILGARVRLTSEVREQVMRDVGITGRESPRNTSARPQNTARLRSLTGRSVVRMRLSTPPAVLPNPYLAHRTVRQTGKDGSGLARTPHSKSANTLLPRSAYLTTPASGAAAWSGWFTEMIIPTITTATKAFSISITYADNKSWLWESTITVGACTVEDKIVLVRTGA